MGASERSLTGRGSRYLAASRIPLLAPNSSHPDSTSASDPAYFARRTAFVVLKHKKR
jgi:hypothetical protein